MKAAIVTEYGNPENFRITQLPTPDLEEGQILVQNKASSVNPVDTLVRQGKTRLITGLFGQHVLGADFAGIVIKSNNPSFKVGLEVFGMLNAVKGGAYAEMLVAEEQNLAQKPSNISFAEAASLPLVGLTAWQGLMADGKLQSGWNVLITGCTGGVGSVAVQIAKHFGNTVTGTCSAGNADFAREIGVDHVIIYDQEQVPANGQFDLIFDASGHFTISDLKGSLTEEGLFVTTKAGADSLGGAIEAAVDVTFQKRMKLVKVEPDSAQLYQIAQLVESGAIKPYVSRTFQLEDLGQAHILVEQGGFTGKIAIEI
ncbi:NAD(P)-dependent alcohol dehydrogenase [Dyadobacter fermentans]|uniref:Alcohol dehydrogenase zinc-binding domain protein n=1 Tax=Dyadobacter fermentans (strain ATCC 700827 / DSM 18053 / CIP 107007 / KCTC 52180 / NS114) TaxID=471854 RepID=C6VUS9_DYAFD|nr:NAD(P)-dependent alcohol dehydrogenase [Dyadobacter fermentans]ACT93066.1 Alcohol dehydrogenase zinc-binding domain protein [Dyadobacter fermentans DSM 18053]